jgi:hypothetical protein
VGWVSLPPPPPPSSPSMCVCVCVGGQRSLNARLRPVDLNLGPPMVFAWGLKSQTHAHIHWGTLQGTHALIHKTVAALPEGVQHLVVLSGVPLIFPSVRCWE